MINLIKEFNNQEIRFIDIEDQRLVCVKDVLEAIGYKNTRKAWYDLKPFVESTTQTTVTRKSLWYSSLKRNYDTDFLDQEQLLVLLLKSNMPSTIPFVQWVVKVIQKEMVKVSTHLVGTEEQLSLELNLLAGRSSNKLQFEYSIEDDFQAPHRDGNQRCRRLDIIEKFPRVTRIYELKRRELTASEVFQSINKMYMELGSKIQPGKPVDFIMVAESITDEAKRYIARYDAIEQYRDFMVGDYSYRGKIRYMTINELSKELYNRIYKNTPPAAVWELNQFCLKYCDNIFSEADKKEFEKKLFRPVAPVKFLTEAA